VSPRSAANETAGRSSLAPRRRQTFRFPWRVFVLLMAGAAVLGACRSSHKKVIAVIPKGTIHIFWQSIQAGALAAGHDWNVEVVWNGPAEETDYSRQIQIMDSMITRRVDAIAVSASDRIALNGALDRAAAAGIPVAVFDSGVDSTNYVTFLATNNYQAGEMAARELGQLLHGKGKVAMLMHLPGSGSTMEREKAFDDVMTKEFPGIQVVARQFGMSDRAKAMAAAENILTAHPGLDGLFGSSEANSVGAAQAFKGRGLAGKIRLVGFDYSDGLLADLRSGTIDALVVQDPFRIGYEAVKTLVDKLNGRTPPKRVDLSARVITKADLEKPEVKELLFRDLGKYLH
jgi:ribose transport system substrate-binding protein